jgi:hypothetical protein
MSAERPVVFSRTKLLEITEERLVLEIPRGLASWWMIVWATACSLAAPAVLLSLKADGAPSSWLAGVAIAGGSMVILPWNWMQGIGFGWSRLAPVTGRVELRRSGQGTFVLHLGQEPEAPSTRRGLFFLDWQGIRTLVLVVGHRVASIAHYLQTGGSGVNWRELGEWDQGCAELARGARAVEQTWKVRSVVPLVHAVLRVLDVGPQPEVTGEPWLGAKSFVLWFFSWVALGGLHVAALLWLVGHPSPLGALGPVSSGLILGAVLLVPDVWLFTWQLRRAWIEPLNRKADEMLAIASASDRPSFSLDQDQGAVR